MSEKSLNEIIKTAGKGEDLSPRGMLPYFIICYLDLENVLDLEQLHVLKEFYDHFLIAELSHRELIVDGMSRDGYAFEPKKKEYCDAFPINKEAREWLERMITEREKAGIETEKERRFLLVLRTILEVKPYFTAKDQVFANNVMDYMLTCGQELISVDTEQGRYILKRRQKKRRDSG